MTTVSLHHSILEELDAESILNNCVRYGHVGTAQLIRGLILENEGLRHDLSRLQCQIINHPPSFSFDTMHMPICD